MEEKKMDDATRNRRLGWIGVAILFILAILFMHLSSMNERHLIEVWRNVRQGQPISERHSTTGKT